MAKTKTNRDQDLYKRLRTSGVRKKVAARVAEALPGNGKANPSVARRAAADLGAAVEEIKDRVKGGPEKRSAAARKAVQTRRRSATKRSQAAKRGARSRKRS